MIRLAIPTGDLRAATAALLDERNVALPDYAAGSRALRFPLPDGLGVARVFREKDIPVQVALGQYDLGICGRLWVEELTRQFPHHDLVLLGALPFGEQELWMVSGGDTCAASVRIASEYPAIAEAVARGMRLPRYRIFGVWGAAAAYPPEDADLALIAVSASGDVERAGLRPLSRVFVSSAVLIANRAALASRDLSPVLGRLAAAARATPREQRLALAGSLPLRVTETLSRRLDVVRLALPDGHAQSHTVAALEMASVAVEGYARDCAAARPTLDMPGVEVKVIRPQDMPQQVAVGHFDVAVTGRDVLFDHLVQFPSSPVEELVDLGRSRYGLAAIVKDVPADNLADAVRWWREGRGSAPIRIASEFRNIADHFARERRLGRYSVIPLAGASEGFVPDEAEILIEGIETGSSVRANKLTVLERFFESTNIVIANKCRPDGAMRGVFDELLERLRAGAAPPVAAGGA